MSVCALVSLPHDAYKIRKAGIGSQHRHCSFVNELTSLLVMPRIDDGARQRRQKYTRRVHFASGTDAVEASVRFLLSSRGPILLIFIQEAVV